MKRFKELPAGLRLIIGDMCKRVGADKSKLNFEKDWFRKYEWTLEQEKDFKDWLFNELMINTRLRHEITAFKFKSKQLVKKVVDGFCFNYGWKYKKGEFK